MSLRSQKGEMCYGLLLAQEEPFWCHAELFFPLSQLYQKQYRFKLELVEISGRNFLLFFVLFIFLTFPKSVILSLFRLVLIILDNSSNGFQVLTLAILY